MNTWDRGTPEGRTAYQRRWSNEWHALVADMQSVQMRIEALGAEGEKVDPEANGRINMLAGAAVGTVEGAISLLRELTYLTAEDLDEEPTQPGRRVKNGRGTT